MPAAELVLVGAGHAHLEVLRRFARRPPAGARLTLLTRAPHTPYSGMLPGVLAGLYAPAEARIALAPLVRAAGARLVVDEAVGLDPAGRRVFRRHGPPVAYDLVSLDIGAEADTGGVPGAAEYAIPLKPIEGLLARLEALWPRLRAGGRVVVAGGGAAGVEVALALARRLGGAALPPCALVTGPDGLLPGFPPAFRARLRAVLAGRGIALHEGGRVAAVEADAAVLEGGERLAAAAVLWATGAAPPRWLAATGLALDGAGFLRVDACLRAVGRGEVFAAGDMIAFEPRPLPRAGVYAVRAGPVLAANLEAALAGRPLRPFRPQRAALVILGTADGAAVATRNGLTVAGRWVWRWKDLLDRRFVRRFAAIGG